MRLLLATGLQRSGTRWARQLFTNLGEQCLHESQFTPTLHGPLTRSESSWLAVPYLDEIPPEVPVFRVIRDPYRIVSSMHSQGFFTGRHRPYEEFARHHCPEITTAPDLLGEIIRTVAHWDAPLDDWPHTVLRVDGSAGQIVNAVRSVDPSWDVEGKIPPPVGFTGGDPSIDRATIDDHPDGHLIRERAARWGYL